ncbi:hypothetical protein KO02_17635 [Sphingobacterium sp. ML3W]|uniref:hypothetical protein n=1 Tax=Sphingobacterium sp. ML3W TaxID=1538644 RepID=UPI0004F731B7|nr:hypothetical protein [Sphingobacterium sp. ML3W]AIM38305.1 hypothetical protein KO02_17635 [Sphingobacterium sp. ML3W]
MIVINNETNRAMSKDSRKRNSYNPVVINHMVVKYGVSKTYIRQSIDGTKKGITCETIRKDYYIQEKAVKAALK